MILNGIALFWNDPVSKNVSFIIYLFVTLVWCCMKSQRQYARKTNVVLMIFRMFYSEGYNVEHIILFWMWFEMYPKEPNA